MLHGFNDSTMRSHRIMCIVLLPSIPLHVSSPSMLPLIIWGMWMAILDRLGHAVFFCLAVPGRLMFGSDSDEEVQQERSREDVGFSSDGTGSKDSVTGANLSSQEGGDSLHLPPCLPFPVCPCLTSEGRCANLFALHKSGACHRTICLSVQLQAVSCDWICFRLCPVAYVFEAFGGICMCSKDKDDQWRISLGCSSAWEDALEKSETPCTKSTNRHNHENVTVESCFLNVY